MSTSSSAGSGLRIFVLIVILLALAISRLLSMPARYEMCDCDEPCYASAGLTFIEGLPPTNYLAPGAPEVWYGWARAACTAAKYVVHPSAEERSLPLQLRPFFALNHALFDLYRDMSGLRREIVIGVIIAALFAAAAGFSLGYDLAGMPGAVLVGGMIASLPVFVEHGVLAKPYSLGWSLGIISIYFAARSKPRLTASAVFMGLAVSSRIELVMIWPLTLILLRRSIPSWGQWLKACVKHVATSMLVTLAVAPTLMTHLIGILRAIATIRLAPASSGHSTMWSALHEVGWNQGLGPAIVLLIVGFFAVVIWPTVQFSAPAGGDGKTRRPLWPAAAIFIALVMLVPMLHRDDQGIRHDGAAVIVVVMALCLAISPIAARSNILAWIIVAVALALPIGQSAHHEWLDRHVFAQDNAVEWVEAHVPPGTVVYAPTEWKSLLPTAQSADAMWAEVTRADAAERKFDAGLARFHLGSEAMPHALSEENMFIERMPVRRFYILGTRTSRVGPRYDLRRVNSSVVFGVLDGPGALKRTGGMLLMRTDMPPTSLGDPIKAWIEPGKVGMYIYASPDVRAKLIP